MPGRFSPRALRALFMAGAFAASLSVGACQPAGDAKAAPGADPAASTTQPAPLPLRVPFLAVMAGSINAASFDIFQAAASAKDLTDDDWLRIGRAAVSLVGDASLITLAGTGPKDAAWAADPDWLKLSADMQSASFAVGTAADARDRAALTEATARLAQSCQSCHLEFSPHLVTSPPAPQTPPPHP